MTQLNTCRSNSPTPSSTPTPRCRPRAASTCSSRRRASKSSNTRYESCGHHILYMPACVGMHTGATISYTCLCRHAYCGYHILYMLVSACILWLPYCIHACVGMHTVAIILYTCLCNAVCRSTLCVGRRDVLASAALLPVLAAPHVRASKEAAIRTSFISQPVCFWFSAGFSSMLI